jgi:hypothetical protein
MTDMNPAEKSVFDFFAGFVLAEALGRLSHGSIAQNFFYK